MTQDKFVAYWDYDKEAPLTCPSCGWEGIGKGNETPFEELLDVRCAQCDRILLLVAYPTGDETRAAAAAGNPRAQKELASVEARETRWQRAERLELKSPGQLPPLPDEEIVIEWDFEQSDGEIWTVLRHQGRELWRELAYFEGYERFAEVVQILRRRYGSRLREVRPTRASETYLYGDRLSAPDTVKAINAELREQ